ncbi:hypothetical protein AG0111_0g12155 [Alternaria gaisen]|uniref:Uncharacterized protein n=1 Tax=Alternaria gaisen TaxID=167740 RepID=A0ACB6F558_9PLEO|nr:hypothetical protein AG0111_0g12155 [Alternaria gaisen]
MKKPIRTLRFGSNEAPATDIRDERYFASALATVTAMSQSSSQQADVDGCFSNLSTPHTERSLMLACFVAHVLRWVFVSPFHVDDSERDDMNNTYSWVAKKCGFQMVRTLDTLATIGMSQNGHFREFEVPNLAAKQSADFYDEFANYVRLNQPLDHGGFKLKGWLHEVTRLQLEVVVSRYHHRIELVRPGSMFDSSWMTEIPDEEGSALVTDTQYRVRLCVSRALVGRIDDTKWSQGPVSTHESEEYKLALLESRDFFAENSVQEKASPKTGLSAEPWYLWKQCQKMEVWKHDRSRHPVSFLILLVRRGLESVALLVSSMMLDV